MFKLVFSILIIIGLGIIIYYYGAESNNNTTIEKKKGKIRNILRSTI
jgi:hypothetical protein